MMGDMDLKPSVPVGEWAVLWPLSASVRRRSESGESVSHRYPHFNTRIELGPLLVLPNSSARDISRDT